jgi:hypothetical protein|tara:strand:- start:995 stop:1405 length:411 start_codon:yes stop_codon:yes gene_type:complete
MSGNVASSAQILQAIIAWVSYMSLSSVPMLSNNYGVNLVTLFFIIPNFLLYSMKGDNFLSYMAIDQRFMLLATIAATLFAALVTQASKGAIKNVENYGKTTKSTGSILALRVVSFLFGLLTAYILLKREGIFANSV